MGIALVKKPATAADILAEKIAARDAIGALITKTQSAGPNIQQSQADVDLAKVSLTAVEQSLATAFVRVAQGLPSESPDPIRQRIVDAQRRLANVLERHQTNTTVASNIAARVAELLAKRNAINTELPSLIVAALAEAIDAQAASYLAIKAAAEKACDQLFLQVLAHDLMAMQTDAHGRRVGEPLGASRRASFAMPLPASAAFERQPPGLGAGTAEVLSFRQHVAAENDAYLARDRQRQRDAEQLLTRMLNGESS